MLHFGLFWAGAAAGFQMERMAGIDACKKSVCWDFEATLATHLQVQHIALVQLVPVVCSLWLYTPLVRVLQYHVTCTTNTTLQGSAKSSEWVLI